ncbi:hypothetical protein D3C80_1356250 [compost metagenome]
MTAAMEDFKTEKMKYENAKKRAKNIRSFYINLMCYCIIIPIVIYVNLKYVPEIQWFWFTMIGWGTGILAHGMEAFQVNPLFSKSWEERKLKQFIEEERQKLNKFNQQ